MTVEDLPPHTPAGLEARLLALMQASYLDSAITESVRIRRLEAKANGTIRWIGAKHLLARVLAPSMTRHADALRRQRSAGLASVGRGVVRTHRPAMLVTSNPGLILAEVPLLRTAVRRGVWTAAIDPSWDNFTNKLLPIRPVDRLIVWNDLMKQQAIDLHGYQTAAYPGRRHAAVGPLLPRRRDDFTRRVLSAHRRRSRAPADHGDDHAAAALSASRSRAARAGRTRFAPDDCRGPRRFSCGCIRATSDPHYAEFESTPEVILEKPFRETVRAGDGLAVDVTADSQQHLADTLRHSDVIVNVASTIAIEAAIFDTPVVNVAFDGEAESPFEQSAPRYYRFTHYVNITRHGAVRVAATPEELVSHVGALSR